MVVEFVKIRERHLEKIRRWRMSEEVTSCMYTDPKITPEDQAKWFRRITDDAFRMDWLIAVDGRDVGVVSIYDIEPLHQRGFWAYYLGERDVQGKGIGRAVELSMLNYVFGRLRLDKLCCEVLESNDFVVKLHLKYGSRVEGVFDEHIWKRNQYHNVVRMGILRQEWESNVKDRSDYTAATIEEWAEKERHVLALLPD